jgi:hypothetical protein
MILQHVRFTRSTLALVALLTLAFAGCGSSANSPRTFATTGKVELDSGDVTNLAGCQIEARLDSDPLVRASGDIGADGTFQLQTLSGGQILNGAPEGTYQARIILSDDDKQLRRKAAKSIAGRYLSFETSGLAFEVPGSGDITLKLSAH